MGGPWTYETERDPGGMAGIDKEFFDELTASFGAGICGRGMYDAAGAWGGTNPFPGTLFVLTHRTGDAPDASPASCSSTTSPPRWTRPGAAAGDGDVAIAGGADLIRQTLAAGYVDELVISTAPVILGGGKALFDGFEQDLDLEVQRVWSSPYATHVRYTVHS